MFWQEDQRKIGCALVMAAIKVGRALEAGEAEGNSLQARLLPRGKEACAFKDESARWPAASL